MVSATFSFTVLAFNQEKGLYREKVADFFCFNFLENTRWPEMAESV